MSLLSSELTPVVAVYAGATSQKLKPSSSVGATPRSDPRLQDVANILGLNLPPNALKVLSQCQASGRLSELVNSSTKSANAPVLAAKRTSTAKRTTARSHTQPNPIKSGGASPYARGVPTPKAVPQPLEAAQYQPPPVKARARRAALAAQSKAKEAPFPSIWGLPSAAEQLILNASWGDRAKSVSLPALQPAGTAQTEGQTQNEAMLPATVASAGPSRAPTRPTTPSGDRLKSASLPALQQPTAQGPLRAAASLSQASLIDRILPRLRGIVDAAAARPKRSDTWVESDAPAPRTTTGSSGNNPLALYEPPFPPTMEMPEVETLDMELPTIEQPATEELTTSPSITAIVHNAESESSTTGRSHPPVSQQFDDLEALLRCQWENPCTAIPDSVQEEPSAALDRILDLEWSQVLQAEPGAAQTAPLTRSEIEMSHIPSITTLTDPNYTTDLEHDVEMADAGIDDLLKLALDLLDEKWAGFVDFEGMSKLH
ncbi:hypothetical protein EDB84DRAFT_1472764 [Lactarius hengduanensis]|nr:hypothetical protein EDB84DRAFT_1472764 [Lactarius hengduanensis]